MSPLERNPAIAAFLEDIYSACNVGKRLARDPLAIAKRFGAVADRELAALVCSTLAFGSVGLIMRACEAALSPLGSSPASALGRMGEAADRFAAEPKTAKEREAMIAALGEFTQGLQSVADADAVLHDLAEKSPTHAPGSIPPAVPGASAPAADAPAAPTGCYASAAHGLRAPLGSGHRIRPAG